MRSKPISRTMTTRKRYGNPGAENRTGSVLCAQRRVPLEGICRLPECNRMMSERHRGQRSKNVSQLRPKIIRDEELHARAKLIPAGGAAGNTPLSPRQPVMTMTR